MNRFRAIVLAFFLLMPFVVIGGMGVYALFKAGLLVWVVFVLPVFWGIAYVLARVWDSPLLPLSPPEYEQTDHWTPQDEKAWEIVKQFSKKAEDLDPAILTNINTYTDVAQELAFEVAKVYHPKADDPLESLTVPEILTAAELAVEDLAAMVEQYVPGSHLLTIDHWKKLSNVPRLSRKASNASMLASAVFSPAAALGRYAISKTVFAPLTKIMQENILNWFYISFLQRVGIYTIEMHSGRLKVGAKKFRQFQRTVQRVPDSIEDTQDAVVDAVESSDERQEKKQSEFKQELTEQTLTICLLGQSGSGKTSLIQALLQKQELEGKPFEKMKTVQAHELKLEGEENLRILDTEGYGEEGASGKALKETAEAIQESDLVLVVHAGNNPARDPDLKSLTEVKEWFDKHPNFKPPVFLGVMTHIDLLSPKMEWSPPYDWHDPKSPKEKNIQEAQAYNLEALNAHLVEVVPVSTNVEKNRVYGIEEYLLPELVKRLEQAKVVSVARALQEQLDDGKVQRVFDQVVSIGKTLFKAGIKKN